MTKSKLEFRQLTDEDVEAFKDIRLEALQKHPEFFLGSYEEEVNKPNSFFRDSIYSDCVIGGFNKATGRLLGIVGFYVITPRGKRAHSTKIWGFYVRQGYRGRGFAKKMFNVLLDEIGKVAEKALLKVHARNRRAIRLFQSLGFVKYGFEARSLKIGDEYHDGVLMVKFLD